MANVIKLTVIANQRVRWCGNLLRKMGIPTPVCELARNDTFLNLMTLTSWHSLLFYGVPVAFFGEIRYNTTYEQ